MAWTRRQRSTWDVHITLSTSRKKPYVTMMRCAGTQCAPQSMCDHTSLHPFIPGVAAARWRWLGERSGTQHGADLHVGWQRASGATNVASLLHSVAVFKLYSIFNDYFCRMQPFTCFSSSTVIFQHPISWRGVCFSARAGVTVLSDHTELD